MQQLCYQSPNRGYSGTTVNTANERETGGKGVEEKAQWLRELAARAGDSGLHPRTHMKFWTLLYLCLYTSAVGGRDWGIAGMGWMPAQVQGETLSQGNLVESIRT